MSDLKLFRLVDGFAVELVGSSARLERDLQRIVESNMEVLFGIRLIASEYSTGAVHRGRMDSLGLDENNTPVIFEYKRHQSEAVINQGLYYLDWLVDHRGDFTMLVSQRLGGDVAANVDFSSPRLICVASDFTRYDEHAIRQMGRSIELVRYQQFDGDLLALEMVASTTAGPSQAIPPVTSDSAKPARTTQRYTTFAESLTNSSEDLQSLYKELLKAIEALGDDITLKETQYYVAFRRLKNFASIEVLPRAQKITVFVKADIEQVALEAGFTRDVTNIGHYGTGNLEITLRSSNDVARAMPLITASYEGN